VIYRIRKILVIGIVVIVTVVSVEFTVVEPMAIGSSYTGSLSRFRFALKMLERLTAAFVIRRPVYTGSCRRR